VAWCFVAQKTHRPVTRESLYRDFLSKGFALASQESEVSSAKAAGSLRVRTRTAGKELKTIAVGADMTLGGAGMGSVSSTNPGLESLLQTLSNLNSPVLSSPTTLSALQKAPAADIVQLSVAATELQGVDEMFGIPDGSNAGTNSILTNLEDLATGSTGTAAAATAANGQSAASPAEQLDNYQTALQAAETQSLFGTGTTSALSNSLFDLSG
jgi:hypothetical protein